MARMSASPFGFLRRAAVLVVALAAGCQPGLKTSEDGAVLYQTSCAQCHGVRGRAPADWKARLDVPDLADPAVLAARTDAQIFDIIKNGPTSRKMPPWGGVYTDAQIHALVAHVRTLAGGAPAATSATTAR
jgi:mono/diheme cytochrome c family protein